MRHTPDDDEAEARIDAAPGDGGHRPRDPTPSLISRTGRPSRLTRERVAATMDEIVREEGVEPSVARLRDRLGGNRTRLTALRDEVRVERLIGSAAPADGSVQALLVKASAAALEALAVEAVRGADRETELVRGESDERVALAERLRDVAVHERDRALEELERARARSGESAEALRIERRARALAQARAAARGEELDAARALVERVAAAHERDASAAAERLRALTDALAEAREGIAALRERLERVERDGALGRVAHAEDRDRPRSAGREARAAGERSRLERRPEPLSGRDASVNGRSAGD